MKSMFPRTILVGVLLALVFSLSLAGSVSAQSKKGSKAGAAKSTKTVAKKSDKEAKKADKKAKDAKKDRDSDKRSAARDRNKKDKLTARERAKADAEAKRDAKKGGRESKKDAAERRRKEAERRAAILEEQRRREQARREAIARRIAFERGLHTETESNILKDNTEGEDLAVRRAAINALGNHAGSVVVMEAQTGKVLTVVNQDWAIRSSIKPCSTIKLVTGVAGLNEGVINKEDGSVRNTSTRRYLDDAIAFSDNGYFQRVGGQVGSTKMIEYARDLGLGQPTGINSEGEVAGKLPFGNEHAKIYSHGEDFEVTGLQLAVMVSAITNGGHRVLPRVPKNGFENARFQPFYRGDIGLPQQNVRRLIPGMMGAAEYGTARRVDHSLGIAGKTGSCISKGTWVGLFASVAPIEQPKYSVVVITRGPSERGKYAAAVAGQVYSALRTHITRTNTNLAQTEFKVQPKSPIDTRAAKMADEEDEDDDAMADNDGSASQTDTIDSGRAVITVPTAPSSRPRLVTKTADSKPVFPPVVITKKGDARVDEPKTSFPPVVITPGKKS